MAYMERMGVQIQKAMGGFDCDWPALVCSVL